MLQCWVGSLFSKEGETFVFEPWIYFSFSLKSFSDYLRQGKFFLKK